MCEGVTVKYLTPGAINSSGRPSIKSIKQALQYLSDNLHWCLTSVKNNQNKTLLSLFYSQPEAEKRCERKLMVYEINKKYTRGVKEQPVAFLTGK